MNNNHSGDKSHLATLIAEALHLADSLDLAIVGISLNGALEHLTGRGIAPEPENSSVH